MADKVTVTNILAVGIEYPDPETGATKTAYIKLPKPKSNLTEQQIKTNVLPLIRDVLNDVHNNGFDTATAIATAYTEDQTTTELDIGIPNF